jgi:diguanylate cyclase (GGDEF)-like protein
VVDDSWTTLSRLLHLLRCRAILVLVLVLGVAAAGAITLLQLRADSSRRAETRVESVSFALAALESAPFSADPRSGGSAGYARAQIRLDSGFISENLRDLIVSGSAPAPLLVIQAAVRDAAPAIQQIFEIGAYRGGYAGPDRLAISREQRDLQTRVTSTLGLLGQARGIYSRRAASASREAVFGSLATVLLLLSIFVLFYRRATSAQAAAEHLSAENVRLLEASRDEAITDPLTALGNRRAFKRELERILPRVSEDDELMVVMFDLDGFKQYNDTFGHGAGDALLARLAGRLKHTAAGSATAYRMGGDEFCLLAQTTVVGGERLVHGAVAALGDAGEGWQIGCSWGVSWMPSEATGASDALRLADERMYGQKAGRATAGYQATAALVQVLIERDVDLSTHISRVAELACATARQLGLPDHEITGIGLAAQLHDIGKAAIPESILEKPAPLDSDEWAFMRRHTLIGERIIAAAPSLAHTAHLVRSSHERFDGSGYPDGLAGTDIPLGARIIAVCDAYDAMIAPRPYREPKAIPDALIELRSCSGSQFDPDVVDAFAALGAALGQDSGLPLRLPIPGDPASDGGGLAGWAVDS